MKSYYCLFLKCLKCTQKPERMLSPRRHVLNRVELEFVALKMFELHGVPIEISTSPYERIMFTFVLCVNFHKLTS